MFFEIILEIRQELQSLEQVMVRDVINEIIYYMEHKTTKHVLIITLIAQHSTFLITT